MDAETIGMSNGEWVFLNKMVADYMCQQQEHTDASFYDPVSMKGYHYLVDCLLFPWDLAIWELTHSMHYR